jgi:hypothetical protein
MSNRTALFFGILLITINVLMKTPRVLAPLSNSDCGKEDKRQERERPAHPRDTPPDRERLHFRVVHIPDTEWSANR